MKKNLIVCILLISSFAYIGVGCKKDVKVSQNSSRLDSLVKEATQAMANVTEGVDPGTFPVGSKGLLQSAIDSARRLQQKSETQFGIDLAEIYLRNALTNFQGSVQIAKQLYFDGTGYLDGSAATPYLTPNITVEAWVYMQDVKTGMYIVSTEGQNTGYKLQCPNAKPTFVIGNGTTTNSIASTATINQNVWVHIAGTFDGTQMKLYVNGTMVASKALTYQLVDNGENFRIGEGSKFTGRQWKGRIRDVGVWNRALTATEIASTMTTKPTGSEAGLIAYWPFNLSAGTTIVDRTGKRSVMLIKVTYADPI